MNKKEYIKPEISIIEMLENTSILAGSPQDTIKDPTLDEGENGDGFGNGEDTDAWE